VTVRQSERKEQTGGWLAAGGPFLARRRPAAGGWRVHGLVCAASVMGFDTVPYTRKYRRAPWMYCGRLSPAGISQ